LRVASGLKPGGQPGHKGTTLKRVENPDHVKTHLLPPACDRCGGHLDTAQAQVAESRQVFDLPPVKLEVTEHRTLTLDCPCGKRHTSEFPKDVTENVQYGARVRAKFVYATQYQLLPMGRTRELMKDWYGVGASTGTLLKTVKRLGKTLEAPVGLIKQAIIDSEVAHFDESGYRINKTLNWLHTAATVKYTWYGCHAKRGKEAMDAQGILPHFKGVAIHDDLAAYRQYDDCEHGSCNAHHLRELVFIAESTEQAWPVEMTQCLCDAKEEVEQAEGQPLDEARIQHYQNRYQTILKAGFAQNPLATPSGRRGRTKQTPATNLLLRLKNHGDDVLRFVTDPRVPFDNNEAERAIRMPKLKQKIGGCFRTVDGADTFCTIRSYLATLKKQGKNLFDSLVSACQGNPPDPCHSG